ncbi:protein timeless-like isoform X1 [Macrosteles quadrilineatus]|uniref:protein timeless-like isoform X1 n=1 Tax=Macrosteles quadrilineatus TaxID=74068 RepID=UPI0023E0B061|nr:protein timeless-like isoform X1 [Macrosteles quadrilineatus]
MEVVMSTQGINSLFAALGCPIGEDYIIGDDCQATLEEILTRLYKEDKYVRGFRRLIANSQVIKKDLLPLFYNVKNDYKILDLIIEILENLMIPVECLFPIDIMIKEDAGRSTICQLNWLLTACKEAFLNPLATKSVIDYVKVLSNKKQLVSEEGATSIHKCLQLLRNLLHIPEVRGGAPGGGASHQNQIIWNLFTQHADKVLIQLMTSHSRALWSVTLVQVISLLYKDQHSHIIHKLLAIWCDTALSESSEDDESNTSPQDQGSGDWSSSMATSDPTSDSSDSDHQKHLQINAKHPHQHLKQVAQHRMTEILANGIGRKAQVAMRNKHGNSKNSHPVRPRHLDYPQDQHSGNKEVKMSWTTSESGLGSSLGSESHASGEGLKMMDCGLPELSECGCDIQNQETISTSSNEDKEPCRFGKKKKVHQKPLHMIQKSRYINGKVPMTSQSRKDLRREKLIKRSKTTTLNIKTFLNHTPNEEDISQLLKEFTIDLLLKGYGSLVTELKTVVLTNKEVHMDTSHFSWLIMYFLRYATLLELDLELISPVLSYDIISYLTYEGVNLCEELEVAKLQVGENLTRTLRKLYLIVSSLKEIVFTIECYQKIKHLTPADHEYLRQLQEKMAHTNDLRCLFVLLLRHFDPLVQSHQFLQDVVATNHSLLLLVENYLSKEAMADHIKQFATEDVMRQYGVLLACFEDNGETVNNCIFTMMHHIAGDLEKVSVLFQPTILSSFNRIVETEFQLSENWMDLVEYVIQKCLKSKQTKNNPSATAFSASNHHCTAIMEQDTQPATCYEHRNIKERVVQLIKEISDPHVTFDNRWSKEDTDNLCWYFPQSLQLDDPIGHIAQLFTENCGVKKNRPEIVENLFKNGLIVEEEYKGLIERESTNNPETIQNVTPEMDVLEGIQVIIDYLHGERCGFFVKWLQTCLLEACYARLLVDEQQEPRYDLVEPATYFYTMLKLPVPLVTWTQDLWKVMQLEPSLWLLSALNFHLPTRTGEARIFARIPAEWTPDHLYVAALILGPVDSNNMKFDPSKLNVIQQTEGPSISSVTTDQPSTFRFFLGSSLKADWIQKVKQLKTFLKAQPMEDKHERMSLISGDERDWDLISLCVSDEDTRHDDSTATCLPSH